MSVQKELTYDELKLEWEIPDQQEIDKETEKIIGQLRAWSALTIGTEIKAKGYNIFVSGAYGTGRTTAVRRILNQNKKNTDHLKDIALVHNFKKYDNPKVLYLMPGKGWALKKRLHDLIEKLKFAIPQILRTEDFKQDRDNIVSTQERQENSILSEFEKKLKEDNFEVIEVTEGEVNATDIVPIYKGETTNFDYLQTLVNKGELSETYWKETREKYYSYMDEMKAIFQNLRLQREEMERKIAGLQMDTVKKDLEDWIKKLQKDFSTKKVKEYLSIVEQDILHHLYLFTSDAPLEDEQGNPALIRYGVHILVDHRDSSKAPVIIENHPNSTNIFGTIESRSDRSGETRTNFMMVKAGSLIQASGGFIVLRADEIFTEEGAWIGLKRALQTGMVEIQMPQSPFGPGPQIKPEPIEVDVKVIIIGSEHFYDLIYNTDQDVHKLFKISAEFDSVMPKDKETTRQFIQFMQETVKRKDLKPLTAEGKLRILNYGVRLAENRERLTTRFSLVNDLLKESNYWAIKLKKEEIDEEAIQKALDEKTNLFSLMEEKMDKQILEGTLLLETQGEEIGQVNGLAVLDRGYYTFGRPMRISAETAPGKEGLINIEREAGLSGEIHDKGLLILESYLRSTFAPEYPLSLWAGIAFEQSYNTIDGDSASSTEAYALVSSLAEIPLRQDLAVTGSIDQKGRIQAVGGVTEKVEGFFDLCQKRGLTGTQGVILPASNVKNLVLKEQILDAIKEKKFHLYAITNLAQGLEILTGKFFYEIQESVTAKLKRFWENSRKRNDL